MIKDRILIVDGTNFIYRAFYGMPKLYVTDVEIISFPTGAILGIIKMLENIRKFYNGKYGAFVFDSQEVSFRKLIYSDYKSNRKHIPFDLELQLAYIYKVVELLGWNIISIPGVEADDVIGTISNKAKNVNVVSIIFSSDKDLTQLVNKEIVVIDTLNNKVRDINGIEKEFGLPPRLIIDYLTLVGDVVDNIPGVDKVGPKTALMLLDKYKSLDNIILNCNEINGIVGKNLRESLNWLPVAKQLVTIKTDCDLLLEEDILASFTFKKERTEELNEIYRKLKFKSLVKNI